MSVHYKFKSALSFDTITFDGLHISIRDLKKAILQQKQIGKASDFDLQITNAQSNEVYEDDNVLVPKNSSLIVVRVPLTSQQKKAEKSDALPALGGKGGQDSQDPLANKLAKTVDLANVEASETDKIQAAITQSTLDYDPSNYLRIKGSNQVGEIPTNYRCYKCFQPGHWIKDCKLSAQQDSSIDIKKSTGIPRSFMVPVEGPEVPGAMMTPNGQFAVPSIEHEARKEPIRKVTEPVVVEKPAIPPDLVCGVCKDLLADAVLIPCCGNSFCDECIRNVLLESEDHQCPDCREKDVLPDTLIPNRFLRNSVNTFKNQTGYVKAPPVPKQASNVVAPAAQPNDVAPSGVELTRATPPPAELISARSPDVWKELTDPSPTNVTNTEKRKTPSPLAEKETELSKDEPKSPLDELQIIEDSSSSSVIAPPPVTVNKTTSQVQSVPPGTAIPSLSNPATTISENPQVQNNHNKHKNSNTYNNTNSNVVESHPIQNIATIPVYTRPPLNPKLCLKGEEPPHHMRKEKPHFSHNRHERSGTPTVDEHAPHMEPSNRYRIEALGGMNPRMMAPMNQPPPMYNQGGYMYHQRPPHYPIPPPRGPPDMQTYPPGVDDHPQQHPRMPHFRGPPYNRNRPRAPFRMHSPNGIIPPPVSSGQIDDPMTIFERMMREKDRQKKARRRSRSISRSYSRSTSPRPRSRLRSRTPRSRTPRSRSRSPRSRSRSRSRSMLKRHRSRSRSRSFSISRYYSQRYKDETYNSSNNALRPNFPTRRCIPKPQEYYQSEYPRHDRYDRFPVREREREKERERPYPKRQYEEPEPMRYEEPVRIRPYSVRGEWEKTRDRELELRMREQQNEYYSGEKQRKRDHGPKGLPVETIEGTSRDIHPPGVVEEERDRVLVDLKMEPQNLEQPLMKSPEKEKKVKEKKKKKKDDSEKKKKKKKGKDKSEKKDAETLSTNESFEPSTEDSTHQDSSKHEDLYADLGANIDQTVVESYSRIIEDPKEIPAKDVMLAPVPELSKWEKEEEMMNLVEENNKPGHVESKQVTSEVLKRAENAIFKKGVNPLKPSDSKKSERRVELASRSREREKGEIKDDRKHFPLEKEVDRHKDKLERSHERDRHREKEVERDKHRSRTSEKDLVRVSSKDAPRSIALPVKLDGQDRIRGLDKKQSAPPRISAKERLGAKVEDKLVVKREVKGDRREIKIEKIPKSVVTKDRSSREREKSREMRKSVDKTFTADSNKKVTAIEESFEPDYEKSDDELEKEDKTIAEPPAQSVKRSVSVDKEKEAKKIKLQVEDEGLISTEDSSLSSDESEKKSKKKKKSKKHKKKKKKRKHGSSSDSDSSSSSSDSEIEKKRRKHKHKSHKKSKKRKKSKK